MNQSYREAHVLAKCTLTHARARARTHTHNAPGEMTKMTRTRTRTRTRTNVKTRMGQWASSVEECTQLQTHTHTRTRAHTHPHTHTRAHQHPHTHAHEYQAVRFWRQHWHGVHFHGSWLVFCSHSFLSHSPKKQTWPLLPVHHRERLIVAANLYERLLRRNERSALSALEDTVDAQLDLYPRTLAEDEALAQTSSANCRNACRATIEEKRVLLAWRGLARQAGMFLDEATGSSTQTAFDAALQYAALLSWMLSSTAGDF